MQINVVTDYHQTPLRKLDSACRIGKNHRFYAHPRKHANRENYLLDRVAFIQMHAALHPRDGDTIHISNHQLSGVTDRCRLREVRNLRVRNLCGISKLIR